MFAPNPPVDGWNPEEVPVFPKAFPVVEDPNKDGLAACPIPLPLELPNNPVPAGLLAIFPNKLSLVAEN